MKHISSLLTVIALAGVSAGAIAQEPAAPGGDLPPALRVLDDETPTVAGEPSWEEGETLEAVPDPEAEVIPREGTILDGSIIGEPMKLFGACPPAYFESSGTWLERGYWYSEVDGLFLNRGWDRKGLQLAFEAVQGTVPVQTSGFTSTTNAPVVGFNELRIRGERPGVAAVGRVKLGRFLFRDSANRDHVAEIGFYGGGDWSQSAAVVASSANGLIIPAYIDRTNPSFERARNMAFSYSSQMNSGEANYLLKTRMSKDQMVLEPTGQWVRKAAPTKTYTYLAGFRGLNISENLGITAGDIPIGTPALAGTGFYNIRTSNMMFGPQLGAGLSYDTARWSIGTTAKFGPYWNRINASSDFAIGGNTLSSGDTVDVLSTGRWSNEENDLSFIGEFQLQGKWHLRPNLSLRTGFEVLFVDSIALAPHQINFIPVTAAGQTLPIAASGDSVFLGTSIGLESYW